jgi:hypothetical protein
VSKNLNYIYFIQVINARPNAFANNDKFLLDCLEMEIFANVEIHEIPLTTLVRIRDHKEQNY